MDHFAVSVVRGTAAFDQLTVHTPASAQQLPSVELVELSLEDTICTELPLLGGLHSRLPTGCRQESLSFPSVLLLFCFLRKTSGTANMEARQRTSAQMFHSCSTNLSQTCCQPVSSETTTGN